MTEPRSVAVRPFAILCRRSSCVRYLNRDRPRLEIPRSVLGQSLSSPSGGASLMTRSGCKQAENEHVMTKQSHDCGRLEGTEAFGLYLTELASSVLAISRQSALLLQALSDRAVLLADMSVQAENTADATSQTTGKAAQCCRAPGTADSCNTSVSVGGNDKPTAI